MEDVIMDGVPRNQNMRPIVSGLVLKNECIALFLAVTQAFCHTLTMCRRQAFPFTTFIEQYA